jgi:hypothetical protein
MKEILFYPSKNKNLITIFISTLFSSLAFYFLYSEILFSKSWWIALGALIFFCVVSVIILYTKFIKPIPSFKLNENGILAYKCPFVEWNNVRDIKIKNVRTKGIRTVYLCVFPYNINKLVDQENLSYLQRLHLFITQSISGTIVAARIDDLSVSQKDLIELINEFKKNWAANYLRS